MKLQHILIKIVHTMLHMNGANYAPDTRSNEVIF